MSRYVLITPNVDFERLVRLATAGMHGSLQVFQNDNLPDGPGDVLRQMVGEPPEVLILGPGISVDGSLKLASVVDLQYPEISVILAAPSTPETVLQAMRAGVRDLLDPGADPDTIRVMLERASLAAAGRRRGLAPQASEHVDNGGGGRIIAVMSPKGGVGKTTVATNLAVGLGKTAPMSVVIVDLDLQFGDVASGLLLEPEFTLTDAVLGAASQDSMVLKTYLTVHPAGIYALCAPRSPVEMDRITAAHVSHLWNSSGRNSATSWWTRHPVWASTSWPRLNRPRTRSGSAEWTSPASGECGQASRSWRSSHWFRSNATSC